MSLLCIAWKKQSNLCAALNLSLGCLWSQSKHLARSAHYLGMIFINRERIALLESKFHF